MIGPLPFRDATVAVLGLARSGLAAAQALQASGARVLAWDDSASARDRAAGAGIGVTALDRQDAHAWSTLLLSPGIPFSHRPHPIVARAQAAGVPVIGDIELLWLAETGAPFIGITGTNGKSTTTALIGHVLQHAGRAASVGGNLGIPVLQLPRQDRDGRYVIELSSYQLDLIDRARFDIAILLNVTPDHLDRHGGMAGYIEAKRRIFRRQRSRDTAIIGLDDAPCREIAAALGAGQRVIGISVERPVAGGVFVSEHHLVDDLDGEARRVVDLEALSRLPGHHNWQNACAAYAACRAAGVAAAAIVDGLLGFPGLAHRQELVGERNGVRFINDSKATNADATAKALGCYEAIHWIAGGVAKAGGIAPLAPFFDRIRHAYLIGEAAPAFAATLEGHVPFSLCGELPSATRAAAAAAASHADTRPVVLLSPACASFDQFTDFEARGAAFRALAAELTG